MLFGPKWTFFRLNFYVRSSGYYAHSENWKYLRKLMGINTLILVSIMCMMHKESGSKVVRNRLEKSTLETAYMSV